MKTILNPTGGRPLKNEDVELIEQFVSMFEGIFSLIEGIGDFIISGCVISGSDVSAGFIYYDSKICTFDGATGVSFPLAMERTTVESAPRTFFDSVLKNSLTTETIAADVGGGFSLSSSTPRLDEYFLRKATQTEGRGGTDNDAAITSFRLLDALRSGSSFVANETYNGVAKIADQATARAGSDNTEIMTALRVLDALRNGSVYQAQTSYPGVVEKATSAEAEGGTANKYIDAALFQATIATTDYNGVVEKATYAEALNGTTDKFIDGELLEDVIYDPTLHSFSYNTNWSSAGLGTVGYMRIGSSTGWVKLKGLVSNSSLSGAVSNALIATLPSGYRPDSNLSFVVIHGVSNLGLIIVQTDGDILFTTIDNYTTNNAIYIESVKFKL